MSETPATTSLFSSQDAQRVHLDQLRKVERFNGRAAMLGLVIGVVVEGLTGSGIAHQIGLGALVDGYAACHTQFLPFCF
ncbi:MAG: high light inducible protein [Cyanobacteria bacterium K_Offshore_surface_m2_239]|nr:high light inducible protein [Cyanobacteria bacterium K_Offshore_surface_m2_239]